MKAKTHLSQAKSRGGFTLVEMLVVIGMIATLAGISFPVYKSIQKKVDKQKLEMIFTGVERAVDDFETEYNHLPHIGSSYPATTDNVQTGDAGTIIGKDFNGSATMTQFFTVLSSPSGAVASCNFKKIKFFETAQAKGGPGNYSNGLVDNGNGTVTLYDPYGFEFTFARVDYNMDGILGRPGQLTTA
ncbi:type II secretion system GspH family protein, partial [Akkermansiaceae bacterium]|nr:type II secretion system GspH family protein [Akkermansiaceae bacterium]